MKQVLMFFAGCIFTYISSLAQKTVIENNKDIYTAPILLQQNDTIIVESDTLYLVNKYRYRIYKQAKESIINLKTTGSLHLIKEYEKALSQLEGSYEEILNKYHQTDSLLQQTIQNNKLIFNELDSNLIQAQHSLDTIKQDLTLAENKLKKNKKKNKISQALWGISGWGIGFLTAAILIR